MFIASIFFILFIISLLKILIKIEKKAKIKIYNYINNSFLIAKALKKIIKVAKIQKIFTKIETWAI